MTYEELKELCRVAWMEKYSYLEFSRLDDGESYCFCNESKKEYNIFKPHTNPS